MPEYTKEQIDEAKEWLKDATIWGWPKAKIALAALEAVQKERDEYAKAVVNSAKIAAKAEGQVKLLKAKVVELEERLQGAGWISVEERLPEALTCVLIRFDSLYGKSNTGVAEYVPPKTVLAEDFLDENAEGCSEYDSGNDCYWVIEGWWENSLEAEMNYKISGNVTHWMPLPKPPKAAP